MFCQKPNGDVPPFLKFLLTALLAFLGSVVVVAGIADGVWFVLGIALAVLVVVAICLGIFILSAFLVDLGRQKHLQYITSEYRKARASKTCPYIELED